MTTGKMRDGYHAVWALGASVLLVLTEEERTSRIVPLASVGGVLCDGKQVSDVLRDHAGGAGTRSPEGLGDQLAKVTQLHASGALTAEEFQAAKRELLGL